MENNGDLLLGILFAPQYGIAVRPPREELHALGERDIDGQPVLHALFRRDRHSVDSAVELRQAHADGDLHRVHPDEGVLPLHALGEYRIRLQPRHTEPYEFFDRRPRRVQGKFQAAHDDVDRRLPVTVKVTVQRLRKRRRTELCVRKRIRKYRDDVQPRRFKSAHERRVIGEIAHDPLGAVEYDARRRTRRVDVRRTVRRDVRTVPVIIGMPYAVPWLFLRRGHISLIAAEPSREIEHRAAHILLSVEPEIAAQFHEIVVRHPMRNTLRSAVFDKERMAFLRAQEIGGGMPEEGAVKPRSHP